MHPLAYFCAEISALSSDPGGPGRWRCASDMWERGRSRHWAVHPLFPSNPRLCAAFSNVSVFEIVKLLKISFKLAEVHNWAWKHSINSEGRASLLKALSALSSPRAVLGYASGGGLLRGPGQLPSSRLQPEDHATHPKIRTSHVEHQDWPHVQRGESGNWRICLKSYWMSPL